MFHKMELLGFHPQRAEELGNFGHKTISSNSRVRVTVLDQTMINWETVSHSHFERFELCIAATPRLYSRVVIDL